MARVFLAEDLKHKRLVAIKVLRPELTAALGSDRFQQEITITAGLSHPHILPLLDSGAAAGFLYYVMPYVEGETLHDRLARERQLPVEDSLAIIAEVLDALGYAHSRGVIHRDVKPGNILLESGHALVADFGIARALSTAGEQRLTATGLAVGTPAYMSPEQAMGEDLDGRSDIYSAASVLYEMLVGEPPFTGVTAQAIVARQMSDAAPRVSSVRESVPEPVERAIAKALSRVPADRFDTAAQFAEVLASPTPSAPAQLLRGSRKPIAWAAVAGVVMIASVTGAVMLSSSNDIGFERRDWILIADLANETGDSVFDGSLDIALSSALQQSQHVNIFPRTRAAETLRRMERRPGGAIDGAVAREIALRENLRVVVVPSITAVDSVYILTIRVVDPATGADLKSRSAQANGRTAVLEVLTDLAKRLRRDLGESRLAIARRGVPLEQVTTSSLEALRAFSEGNWHFNARRFDEGRKLYERAIELDSNFVQAHKALGVHYYWTGDRERGDPYLDKALALIDRLPEGERLWVTAEIQSWRDNREAAISNYRIYVARYPDVIAGWYDLGYASMMLGRYDDAIEAFERVVSLDSVNAGAYINIATSLRADGRPLEALPYYHRAFDLRTEWRTSGNLNHEFGFTYVAAGMPDSAELVFRLMESDTPSNQAKGRRSLALLSTFQGRYGDAIDDLRQAILLSQRTGATLSEFRDRLYLATVYRGKGMTDRFEAELRAADSLTEVMSMSATWLQNLGLVYARKGDAQRLSEIFDELAGKVDKNNRGDRAARELIRGEVELANGNTAGAVGALEAAYTLTESNRVRESLALAYAINGDDERAIDLYREMIDDQSLGWEAQEPWVLSHFIVARLYHERGDTANAVQYYDRFLEIWAMGDDDLAARVDARQRLAALVGEGGSR